MVRKTHNPDTATETDTGTGRDTGSAPPFSDTVKESASQIWLAGLGAFARAQEEGSKVFDALVRKGHTLQRESQASAADRFSDASGRMASAASEFSSRATGQWDKLESLFEERVAKEMKRLGVPSAREVEALQARIEELERQLGSRTTDSAAATRRSPGMADESADHPTPRKSTRRSV